MQEEKDEGAVAEARGSEPRRAWSAPVIEPLPLARLTLNGTQFGTDGGSCAS